MPCGRVRLKCAPPTVFPYSPYYSEESLGSALDNIICVVFTAPPLPHVILSSTEMMFQPRHFVHLLPSFVLLSMSCRFASPFSSIGRSDRPAQWCQFAFFLHVTTLLLKWIPSSHSEMIWVAAQWWMALLGSSCLQLPPFRVRQTDRTGDLTTRKSLNWFSIAEQPSLATTRLKDKYKAQSHTSTSTRPRRGKQTVNDSTTLFNPSNTHINSEDVRSGANNAERCLHNKCSAD